MARMESSSLFAARWRWQRPGRPSSRSPVGQGDLEAATVARGGGWPGADQASVISVMSGSSWKRGIAARRKAGVENETLDAIHDHNEIRDAVTEVARHAVGSDDWYAAVAGANVANGDHMAEEEREGLTDFRRVAGLQQRHSLAVAFAAFEARNVTGVEPVDKDPAAYVSQVEEGTSPAGDGSLRIGDLRRT